MCGSYTRCEWNRRKVTISSVYRLFTLNIKTSKLSSIYSFSASQIKVLESLKRQRYLVSVNILIISV